MGLLACIFILWVPKALAPDCQAKVAKGQCYIATFKDEGFVKKIHQTAPTEGYKQCFMIRIIINCYYFLDTNFDS